MMADSTSERYIQLHDFTIRSPHPLPALLYYPSRLALKFSVNGVDEVLNASEDTEDGTWKMIGDVIIREDQQLTITVLVSVEDSTKEQGTATFSYSQLLARAEAPPRECYKFTIDGSTSSIILLVTCYIRTSVTPPRKQYISTEPVSPENSKPDEGHIISDQALTPADPYASTVAEIESYYDQAASFPAKRKAHALNAAGCAYQDLYDATDEMAYLDRAISILGEALENANSHPRLPEYSNNLTTCLLARFTRTRNLDDINHAISRSQDAVRIVEIGDPNRHCYISNHATALLERFECLGDLEDLQNGISLMNTAMGLVPDGHRNKLAYLNNLGNVFSTQFDRLGRVKDLETAIAHWQKAVDLMPDGHPDKSTLLNVLGTAFKTRFIQLSHIEDLETAITHKQKAVDLTPDGHPDKSTFLEALGATFKLRFERFGRIEDLETTIIHRQKAVDLMPDDHPDKPNHLSNLSIALKTRFNQLGGVNDLETAIVHNQEAVNLTPDDHPDKPRYLNNLGNYFSTRFDRLGHIKDLEIAITYVQKATDLTPDGHPHKPGRLENLGRVFQTRFVWSGHLDDLEVGILYQQKAVDLTPDDHSDKPNRLSDLGNAFERRFDWLGHVNDLETAITYKRKAVDLTPDGHPDRPMHLSNLGIAYETRFDRLGRIQDLEVAILRQQKAVDLTPDNHPDKPSLLNNLGNTFEKRFQRSSHIDDLETAIAHKQKAVDLTPDDHPDKSGNVNNLGNAFYKRFNRLDSVGDLETAITHWQQAVDLTPDDHPDKPGILNNLGLALKRRFERLGRIEDLNTAITHFSTAALLPTGSSRARLDAARYWAATSEQLLGNAMVSEASYLEPYHVMLDLLPRVAWLGVPMSTQHALLKEVGGILREAVTTAIIVEKYETAVEWAEAGRSVAWQNLLNLRTPISDLRSAHDDLADRLEAISRQLEMSVRGSDNTVNGATDGMKEVSRSHVQLALDWDNTVSDIRSKPGFGSFLKPKCFNELGRIPRDGPVVILNITEDRCDALVLNPEDGGGIHVSSVPLPNFSYVKSETLLKELKQLLQSRNLRERDARPMKRKPRGNTGMSDPANILRCLWIDVVKPIIEALAYQPQSTELPHMWWCTTGALAFLPIHAAGIYDTEEPGNKLSDYVVSSYTPTVSALLDDSPSSQEDFTLLAIAQANAPGASSIPKTELEVEQIQKLAQNINVTTMTKEDATVENVWHGMEKSNWVHLACHGQQNIKEPMKSGLLLHDGTLELQRLIEKPLPLADFAFLSACQTATGDENVAEESLHLAAGMLFAGYKGVIATMWSIMDDVGPRVAEEVYREMLKGGKPNRKAAAHALHEAVKRLREDPKVDMLHWVPFIHIGL